MNSQYIQRKRFGFVCQVTVDEPEDIRTQRMQNKIAFSIDTAVPRLYVFVSRLS